MQFSEVKKTIITVLGLVVTVGTALAPMVTDLSPDAAALISTVLAVATAVLNFLVPNETTDPERALTQSARLKQPAVGRHALPEE